MFCTKSSGSLYNHKQKEHKGRFFKCHTCDFQSAAKHSLKSHIQIKHEGLVKKKVQCDQCSFSTAHLSNLYSHKQGAHNGRVFKCQTCDYESLTQLTLNRHIKIKHGQTRNGGR